MIIDSRLGHTLVKTQASRAAALIADLRKMGVPARLGKLAFGDVSFAGLGPDGADVMIGIELKSIGGLLTDLTTGRFAGYQVPGMQGMYRYRYLIVEGAMRPSTDGLLEIPRGFRTGRWWSPSPITYVDFLRIIDDIELRGGFHVRRTWGRVDTLSHIVAEWRGWRKPWDQHKALKHLNEAQSGVVMLASPTLTRLWARDLPGVGWERSAEAERHFRSPLALALASAAEWMTIPGIGKTIAARVWKAIRGLK
jgi:ERCC4-type nuclease